MSTSQNNNLPGIADTDFVFQSGYLPRQHQAAFQQAQSQRGSAMVRDYRINTIAPALTLDPVQDIYLKEATPVALEDIVTHSRASTATFTDRHGILQTAAADTLRTDHHIFKDGMFQRAGLRVDPSATNLLEHSQDFSQSEWRKTNSNILGTTEIAPDGSSTAAKIEPTSNQPGRLIQALTVPAAGKITLSMYLKAGTGDTPMLLFNGFGATGMAWFDLTAGTVGTINGDIDDAVIEPYAEGWFRCSISKTIPAGNPLDLSGEIDLRLTNADGSTVSTANETFLVWGAQMEMDDMPTAYIETGASTTARAADALSIDNTQLPDTPNGYTIVVEGFLDWLDAGQGATFMLFWTKNGSSGERVRLSCLASSSHVSTTIGEFFLATPTSASAASTIQPSAFTPGMATPVKMALSCRQGSSVQLAVNGVAQAASSASGVLQSLNTGILTIADGWGASLSRFRIFDVALPEAALIDATTL